MLFENASFYTCASVSLVCYKYKKMEEKNIVLIIEDNKSGKQEVTEQKLFAALTKFQFTTFAANTFLFKSVKAMLICGGTVGGEGLCRFFL